MNEGSTVIVHLASGIGNIVLATPLLLVLSRHGFIVDLLLDADYPGVEELFAGWSVVRRVILSGNRAEILAMHDNVAAAIPPFYWQRFRACYAGVRFRRPPDALFYNDERQYYLEFARFLGCDTSEAPTYFLPRSEISTEATIILAPGSKPGEMAAKRWPFFVELANAFDDVALVGTPNDIVVHSSAVSDEYGSHVKSFIGLLSLKGTASLLAGAKAVIANDNGIGHMAGALGIPTLLLFGPTPDRTLGQLPPNVIVLRTHLACEPCWFGTRFQACNRRIDCLQQLSLDGVIKETQKLLRASCRG